MPPSKKACLAPHAKIIADDALWAQCKQLGTQEDYDDAGNRADLSLANCTCGSTLSRPVKRNPAPAGTRYWVGDASGEDMKSRAAVEHAIADCATDPDRNSVRIFSGVPGRGAPVHAMTIRAHANYPDRYVLEVVNTERAPARIWTLARGNGGRIGDRPVRNLTAVVSSGRQAPGELSAEETRRRLDTVQTLTGLRGWVFENGRGEWEIQVDSEAFADRVIRDDDRVDDDDVAQLNEVREALAERQRELGPDSAEFAARAAITTAMHIQSPLHGADEQHQAAEFVQRVAAWMSNGALDWSGIRDLSLSARSPEAWEQQVQRNAMEAGLRAVDAYGMAYSLQRPPVAWVDVGQDGNVRVRPGTRVPIRYTLPENLTELELAIARVLNLATPGGSIFPAGRRFIAAVYEQLAQNMGSGIGLTRQEPGTSEFARAVTTAARAMATEAQFNWIWVEDGTGGWQIGKNVTRPLGMPPEEEIPQAARGIAEAMGRRAPYEDPLRQAEWEEAALEPGPLRNLIAAELRLVQPIGDLGERFVGSIIAQMRTPRIGSAAPALTREYVADNVDRVASRVATWSDNIIGWIYGEGVVPAWQSRAREPSIIAAQRAAAAVPPPVPPREERLRTIQATRHGELALTPRQRAQRFQEQLHVAIPETPAIPATGTRVAVPGTPAQPGTRVQLRRTVVHGVEVYPKGAAGEVVHNDYSNLVVRLDDGEFASWTPKYLEYLDGDLEIESDTAARVRQLESTPGKRVSQVPDDDDSAERFKMIELNPVQNPAWVTNLLAKHFEFLEGKVPARWLPKLTNTKGTRGRMVAAMKEYGSGVYGTVLPTLDPKVVLKLTTDSTEFEFANELAANLTAQVTCEYHLVAGLPEKHQGRHTYLLWRDAADHVGKLGEYLDAHGRDGDAAEAAIDVQHRAAQAVYSAFLDGEPAKHLIKKWETAARAMAKIPELAELADGMIVNLHEDKVFLGDLHGGNIGLIGDRWLCVDPGNVARLEE